MSPAARPAHRITRPADYRRARRDGRSFAHALVILQLRANGLPQSRFGVTTDRTLTGAVRRNRARRRTREALRRVQSKIQPGWDVVIVARAGAVEAEFSRIEAALERLLERGGVTHPKT